MEADKKISTNTKRLDVSNIPVYKRKQVYECNSPMPKYKSRQYQTVRLETPNLTAWKRPYEHHQYELPKTTGILVCVKKKTLDDLYEEISKNYYG